MTVENKKDSSMVTLDQILVSDGVLFWDIYLNNGGRITCPNTFINNQQLKKHVITYTKIKR